MTQNANRTIALSTQINRCLFDGDLERTLYLIGELMRTGGLSVPARALAAIPVRESSAQIRPMKISRPGLQRVASDQ
ncbi:hypothetical protein [Stappia sp.]|jgi:hypothetical protein|uniref:hypothetical protein n=1 Tax=Stappia sp. TaxID=1870903 RepID=UPI003D0CBFC3